MVDDVRVDLVRIDRAARHRKVVDRDIRWQAERETDVAELEVEVDQNHALAALGQHDGEVRGRERLARTALRPEHRHDPRVVLPRRGVRAQAPLYRLVDREAHLLARLGEREDVLGAELEDPPDEAGGRTVGKEDHRSVGIEAHRPVDEKHRPVGEPAAGDDDDVELLGLEGRRCAVEAGHDAVEPNAIVTRKQADEVIGVEPVLDGQQGSDRLGHCATCRVA